jgi:hypothetical protein
MRKGGTKRQLMVRLKTADRRRIAAMLRGGIGPVRVIKRAQVLRLLDQGVGPPQVADAVGVSPQTVRDVGWRCLGEGLDRAPHEKPRPGHQPALSPGKAQRIVAMVCGPPPEGRARWSVRLIAEEAMKRRLVASVGRETIRVLLKQHDLKPWRKKMCCVGAIGADYIARMEEVLATYEQPLQAEEPVVCLDDRPVRLTADTRPPTPARPGVPARYDYEYRGHGTANLFCVVEPQVGWHLVRATPNRTRAEFAKVIRARVDHYPGANTIHLVMDNLNIHARTSLTNT